MNTIKIAINGFGRIGRLVTRALLEMDAPVDIVAINDLSSTDMLANLFEFDSIHGRFNGTVAVEGDDLIFNGDRFKVLAERNPEDLPWKDLEVDYVIESTGLFRNREGMTKHLKAGAKRVILSAPASKHTDVDITICRGINDNLYDPAKHFLVSNASCTTNCLAPLVKVIDENFGFESGNMTTIHSYTNDQRLLDSQHKDFRRARAAGMNMVPTSTGAAKAIGLVLPHLDGKISGLSVRVPTPNVSLVDLSAVVKKNTTTEEVTKAFQDASKGELKGILRAEWRSLVSTDFNHNPHSSIVDIPTLSVTEGNHLKVLSWYDNEWGFSNRLAELVHLMWDKDNQ